MDNEAETLRERAEALSRRGAEARERLRQALAEDSARAADAARERREATRVLRRGQP